MISALHRLGTDLFLVTKYKAGGQLHMHVLCGLCSAHACDTKIAYPYIFVALVGGG